MEDAFLKATEYKTRWGYEWTMYRPIVEFCRKNGVPLAALTGRSLFLTNAVRGIEPIRALDGMAVPPDPRTAELAAAFWP